MSGAAASAAAPWPRNHTVVQEGGEDDLDAENESSRSERGEWPPTSF